MLGWSSHWRRWRDARTLRRRPIPDALWQLTLARFPFLSQRNATDGLRLRELATLFLASKEFSGANGLDVSDEMAVAIAAQACLPIVHLRLGLAWYDGFVGIVVHPDVVVARREVTDDDGIVHGYDEELSGEAMHGGPIMLAWTDVSESAESASLGYNVVIHEFAHVLDMCDGVADGIPPLPDRAAREHWAQVIDAAFADFCADIDAGVETFLDPYGAEGVDEFFAVLSEAFFVAPHELNAEHPSAYELLRGFYRQDPAGRE